MKEKKVDVVTSAADMITMDGFVVNKVGTMSLALLANYYGIPYYCTGTPNLKHETIETVKIEERDPSEVMELLGTKVTMEGVKAYYPAFDITPPSLVSGVVTNKGVYSAFDLKSYFN
jgi:methylthioribose-1-phosphate isomerase